MRSGTLDRDRKALLRFVRNQDGGVLVETTVMMTIIFVFVLGGIDFLFAFYQWNAASKAVQLGARIAAVSDPVATGLIGLSTAVVGASGNPGDQTMPSFTVTCDGHAATCTCSGTCTGVSGYNATAMRTIVYGRNNSGACNTAGGIYFAGMCNMYPPIKNADNTFGLTTDNVKVIYTSPGNANGGLGYIGRPDGPVPTVQVSLQRVNFTFYFLSGLLGFGQRQVGPSATSPTTVTGEALSSSAQCFTGPC
jgi:Flp pilus assembly pilin Flp